VNEASHSRGCFDNLVYYIVKVDVLPKQHVIPCIFNLVSNRPHIYNINCDTYSNYRKHRTYIRRSHLNLRSQSLKFIIQCQTLSDPKFNIQVRVIKNDTCKTHSEFNKCISTTTPTRFWHEELETQQPILIYPQRCFKGTLKSSKRARDMSKPIAEEVTVLFGESFFF
jgi:hypothetical protein